jgi:hypothetical protein
VSVSSFVELSPEGHTATIGYMARLPDVGPRDSRDESDGTMGATMTEIRTVGYESASLEQFVAALVAADVHGVIDIRELPLSRRRGFSKGVLRQRL